MKKKLPQGISSVLILGVIAILVTIVVPLLSRTVVDIRISKQQEEQARAFSFAESALEKYLIDESWTAPSDVSYTQTETLTGSSDSFLYPQSIEKNLPITIWLVDHDDAGLFNPEAEFLTTDPYQGDAVNLFWGTLGTPGDSAAPAIETTLFYRSGNDYKVQRNAFDPYAASRGSGFDQADIAGGGAFPCGEEDFEFSMSDVAVPCGEVNTVCYALRIRLIHSSDSHPVCLIASDLETFPVQASCREVVATIDTSGVSSRVQRCLFYKDFPAIFDFVLYSESDLIKNLP